jgi:hypothetical protein
MASQNPSTSAKVSNKATHCHPPILIFINPLLTKLNTLDGYKPSHALNITNLTFADDLNLIAENMDQMMKLIREVETFCQHNAIQINYTKSKTAARISQPLLTASTHTIPTKRNRVIKILGAKSNSTESTKISPTRSKSTKPDSTTLHTKNSHSPPYAS